jgi:hypothetical protein
MTALYVDGELNCLPRQFFRAKLLREISGPLRNTSQPSL